MLQDNNVRASFLIMHGRESVSVWIQERAHNFVYTCKQLGRFRKCILSSGTEMLPKLCIRTTGITEELLEDSTTQRLSASAQLLTFLTHYDIHTHTH